jgi:hypothetical protein
MAMSHGRISGVGVRRRDRRLIVCPQSDVQIKIEVGVPMERALRQWLESHGLLAIVAGVVGAILVLALLFVLGGFLIGFAASGS